MVALELHRFGGKCELEFMLSALVEQAVIHKIVLTSTVEKVKENAYLFLFVHLRQL